MGRRPRNRNFNLGNLLVLLSVVGLGVSFWVPYGTAERTARVEGRAGDIAKVILATASAMQPIDLQDPFTRAVLQARVVKACDAWGLPASNFLQGDQPIEPFDWPSLVFRGRHYCFQVTVTPADRSAGAAVPPVEVYAWPNNPVGPGHTVFFFPETGEPAFSRNLVANYAAFTRAPRPGAGRHRPLNRESRPEAYRGYDEERWLRYR